MTLQTLLPEIGNRAARFFGRNVNSRPAQAGSAISADTERDRYAVYEEMLLSNPAAFASEIGMQWMHTAYPPRY